MCFMPLTQKYPLECVFVHYFVSPNVRLFLWQAFCGNTSFCVFVLDIV